MGWLGWIVLLVAGWLVFRLLASKSGGAGDGATADVDMLPAEFVVFDLETTGLNAQADEIIEIGAILVTRAQCAQRNPQCSSFQALVKPAGPLPAKITKLTGITQAMLDADGQPLAQVLRDFSAFVGSRHLVAYNAEFDRAFLAAAGQRAGIVFDQPSACALKMARRAFPGRKSYKLAVLAESVDAGAAHRALADCKRALVVYILAARTLRSGV